MLCGSYCVRKEIVHLKEINTHILEGQKSSPVEMALAFNYHHKLDSNRENTEGKIKNKDIKLSPLVQNCVKSQKMQQLSVVRDTYNYLQRCSSEKKQKAASISTLLCVGHKMFTRAITSNFPYLVLSVPFLPFCKNT